MVYQCKPLPEYYIAGYDDGESREYICELQVKELKDNCADEKYI
jgi:hypothetical protein